MKFDKFYEELMLTRITEETFIKQILDDKLSEGFISKVFDKLGDIQRYINRGVNKLKNVDDVDTDKLIKTISGNLKKRSEMFELAKNAEQDETQVEDLIDKIVDVTDTLAIPKLQNAHTEVVKFEKKNFKQQVFDILRNTKFKKLNIEYRLTLLYLAYIGQLNFDTTSNVGVRKKVVVKPGIRIK